MHSTSSVHQQICTEHSNMWILLCNITVNITSNLCSTLICTEKYWIRRSSCGSVVEWHGDSNSIVLIHTPHHTFHPRPLIIPKYHVTSASHPCKSHPHLLTIPLSTVLVRSPILHQSVFCSRLLMISVRAKILVLHSGFKHSYNAVHKNSAMQSTAVFLLDPTIRAELKSLGGNYEVWGSEVPQRGPVAEPLQGWEVRGQTGSENGFWGSAPQKLNRF